MTVKEGHSDANRKAFCDAFRAHTRPLPEKFASMFVSLDVQGAPRTMNLLRMSVKGIHSFGIDHDCLTARREQKQLPIDMQGSYSQGNPGKKMPCETAEARCIYARSKSLAERGQLRVRVIHYVADPSQSHLWWPLYPWVGLGPVAAAGTWNSS